MPKLQYILQVTLLTVKRNTPFTPTLVAVEKDWGLSPNFHIHVSVSDLYIPTIGLPILLEKIFRPILGMYKSLT
jgi:hypothetical protein